jgi:hypothetical protein
MDMGVEHPGSHGNACQLQTSVALRNHHKAAMSGCVHCPHGKHHVIL